MPFFLAAAQNSFIEVGLDALAFGSLIALIALGYTMVYGIIGLINFAHGDVFMLGAFLSLAIIERLVGSSAQGASALGVLGILMLAASAAAAFCSMLNLGVDRLVYRPL